MDNRNSEKERLLASLTQEQKQDIKKENPYRRERDSIIHELTRRGVSYPLLAEVTGLGKSSIGRIAKEKINYVHNTDRKSEVMTIDYKKLREAFEAFYDELLTIITNEKGGDRLFKN